MENSVIFSCGCGNTDEFSQDAFKILFPDEPLPELKHQLSIDDDERIRDIVAALKKTLEPYSYYFKYGEGKFEAWDLYKGVRVL